MRCPICQCSDSRVLESRTTETKENIRRRRECLNCRHRFTTYETIEWMPSVVVKRSGERQGFDGDKILHGLQRACEKTPVTAEDRQQILDALRLELQQRSLREVSTQEIGERILELLLPLNEVAYLRFASVHQQFQNADDFQAFVHHLNQVKTLNQGIGDESLKA